MKKLIKFLIIFIIILLCVCLGLSYYKDKNKSNNKNEKATEIKEEKDIKSTNTSENKEDTSSTLSSNSIKSYEFANEFGDGEKDTKVDAKDVISLSGFAGASSNVYYIDSDNTLHYLELVNLTDTKIATNIKSIKLEDEELIAYKSDDTKVLKENEYVEYK